MTPVDDAVEVRDPDLEADPAGALDWRQELDDLARVLQEEIGERWERREENQSLKRFYEFLRSTRLPWLPQELAHDPWSLYQAGFEILHRLGSISPAVGLAFENHFYLLSALATLPLEGLDLPGVEDLTRRRDALLERITGERLLVANTNSRIHADRLNTFGIRARREADGFRVSGSASYMSLSGQGDLMFFLTLIEGEGVGIFHTELQGNPRVTLGDEFLFPSAMIDSDTRRVSFDELHLPEDGMLVGGGNEEMTPVVTFQLTWHQTLIGALYLGAAARALEEARLFLRQVQGPGGAPLAELDGMVVDMGRLALRYRAACCAVHQSGATLTHLAATGLRDPSLVSDAFDLAGLAKHTGTGTAEEVVAAARKIVGARAFTGGQALERLSDEVIFGPLGPEVNAFIERRYGEQALGEESFLSKVW